MTIDYDIRFLKDDLLFFSLKNGENIIGNLKRTPQVDHLYWYVTIPNDTTIIAINTDSVLTVMKPSVSMLQSITERNEDGD